MNFIDIIIIAPLLYAAWVGFRKGLIIEIFTLLALLVGIYVGINFSDYTANLLIENFQLEGEYLPVVAFTITFLGVGAMVYFLGKVLEKMLKIASLSFVNKIAGLALGLVKMVYVLSVLIILIETYDERGHFINQEIKEDSALYDPMKSVATFSIPAVEKSSIWLKNSVQEVMEMQQE